MRFAAFVLGAGLVLVPSIASATYAPPPPKPGQPVPALAHTPDAPVFRQKVELVASQVTGAVVFKDGDKVLGQADAVAATGTATLEVDSLEPGSHSIMATTAAGAAIVSSAHVFTIAKASTKVELAQTLDSTPEKETATFLAKVTSDPGPVADGGDVVFLENGVAIGAPISLKDGIAKLELLDLAVGPHTLTAMYKGSNEFTESGSTAVTHTIVVVQSATPPAAGPTTTPTPSSASPAAGGGEDDSGCTSTGHGSTSSAWLVGLALLLATRARSSRASRARSSRREA